MKSLIKGEVDTFQLHLDKAKRRLMLPLGEGEALSTATVKSQNGEMTQ